MDSESKLGEVAEAAEPLSMADSVAAAFDAVEEKEKPVLAEGTETSPDTTSETDGAKQEAKSGLVRDKEGKIVAKEEKPESAEEKPEGTEEKSAAKVVRAPGSWKPATREKFAKLDPDVQQEIIRREREISQGFNDVSEVKKFREHFMGSVNQYAHVINAEGGKPLETIHNLLQTANVLYTGTPVQKAHTVAAIIKNFGISLETLDDVLSGQGGNATASQQPDISSIIQAELTKALGPLTQRQQAQEQQVAQDTQQEIQDFMDDPANEFSYDVRETMADLLEASAKRNQKMDLPTAYSRAILAHNDIAEVVARRKTQESVTKSAATAAAAKKKSVSISGAPEKVVPGSGNMRDTILAAMEQHGV